MHCATASGWMCDAILGHLMYGGPFRHDETHRIREGRRSGVPGEERVDATILGRLPTSGVANRPASAAIGPTLTHSQVHDGSMQHGSDCVCGTRASVMH